MSVTSAGEMLRKMLDDLLTANCTPEYVERETQNGAVKLWKTFAEQGLTLASVPEASGGEGGDRHDDRDILIAAGRYAAPLPLVETGFVGAHLLASAGLPVPEGKLALVIADAELLRVEGSGDGYTLNGSVPRVAFAHHAERLAVVAAGEGDQIVVMSIDPEAVRIEPGMNLVGEPRDAIHFEDLTVPAADSAVLGGKIEAVRAQAALGRALMMVGAMQRVLRLVVEYASDRVQFGKPISSFQAVQTLMALVAEDVALCEAAVTRTAEMLAETGEVDINQAAVAKATCSTAATRIAEQAHQVFGAIGVTLAHPLHLFTGRLLAWRDDYGSEMMWSALLGRRVLAHQAGVWDLLTTQRPDTGVRR